MTSPLSLNTFGMLSPPGGGGGNTYLTGGIDVSVELEVAAVDFSLAEVAVSVSNEIIDVIIHGDQPSPVGIEFNELAISA